MEDDVDLVLIPALFGWAALIFYNVGREEIDFGLGAVVVLIGAILGTFLLTGALVPTKGEPIGALIDWVQSVYGAAGLGALVFGAVLGLFLGGQKRQGG